MNTIYIKTKEKKVNLTLDQESNIIIYNQNLEEINISVLDNIIVNIDEYNNNSKGKTKINLSVTNNSNLKYNLSNIVNNDYQLDIDINYQGNDSKVETSIHGIVKSKSLINIIGTIENNCKNNELLENVKIILEENGICEVNPFMVINTKEVIANHKVAISKLRKDELFYLMTKGLSKLEATKLIKRSFLISNIQNSELKMKINSN